MTKSHLPHPILNIQQNRKWKWRYDQTKNRKEIRIFAQNIYQWLLFKLTNSASTKSDNGSRLDLHVKVNQAIWRQKLPFMNLFFRIFTSHVSDNVMVCTTWYIRTIKKSQKHPCRSVTFSNVASFSLLPGRAPSRIWSGSLLILSQHLNPLGLSSQNYSL